MKSIVSVIFLFSWLTKVSAQEKHFMFIQADNNQPFYVQLNDKLFSSSASGHVIIPKLTNSTYNFRIGFPQNAFPEQIYEVPVTGKDLGFSLKNFGDKGWALFNLQSFETVRGTPGTAGTTAKIIPPTNAEDEEEMVISFNKAPKDTSVIAEAKPAPVANNVQKEPLTVAEVFSVEVKGEPVLKLDSAALAAEIIAAINDNLIKEPIVTPEFFQAQIMDLTMRQHSNMKAAQYSSDVKKLSEVKTIDSLTMSFVDQKGFDTIQVVIASSATVTKVPEVREITKATTDAEVRKLPSSCTALAAEEDYYRLRKKMLNQMSDEKMIAEAKKVYQVKCFTTAQVKALSSLFMSDDGRYKFFDASYNHVADPERYSSLQSELIDTYFVNRFKAMLR